MDATPNQVVPSSLLPGPSRGTALVENVVELVDDSSDEEELSDDSDEVSDCD